MMTRDIARAAVAGATAMQLTIGIGLKVLGEAETVEQAWLAATDKLTPPDEYAAALEASFKAGFEMALEGIGSILASIQPAADDLSASDVPGPVH